MYVFISSWNLLSIQPNFIFREILAGHHSSFRAQLKQKTESQLVFVCMDEPQNYTGAHCY